MRLIKVFKYKLVPLIFIMILCFTGCKTTEDTSPHAKQGIMELSQWDFNKSGNVKLDGEWGVHKLNMTHNMNFILIIYI